MATRTDLGKIMLTNGGAYDPEKAYEKNTFVLFQNSTYLALQTVTGVEPADDRVNWQLMAKGFAGSETQIEGYVFVDNEEVIAPESDPALDADKLGGNLPEYYAPQHEISDAFSENKAYAVGDYCIYLNALYRFTKAKAAGAWDGTAVVPVTLAQEIAANTNGISTLKGHLKEYWGLVGGTPIPNGADLKSSEYLIPGNYRSGNNDSVATLKNCPVNNAFVLKVDYSVEGGAYPRQTFVTYRNEWVARTYSPSNGSWFEDCSYALKSDLGGCIILAAGRTNRFFVNDLSQGSSENYTVTVSNKGQKSIHVIATPVIMGASADVLALRASIVGTTTMNITPILTKTISESVSIYVDYIVFGII